MGKLDKLIAELLRDDPPCEMAYRDLATVLGFYGWTEREAAGSHIRWRKSGHRALTISIHGDRRVARVGKASIQDVIDAISDRRLV